MAMYRRPRGGSVRHPPSLAPTVSAFKPRAQWKSVASSIFLYVNLPGFYRDQIEVKKDEKTRTIQIQGQRPLSTHTKARFSEAYRVPDSCDINNMNISFSHGLLTIEFPLLVPADKPVKPVQEQGKIVEKPEQEVSSLGSKKALEEEKLVGTSGEKTSPKAKEEEIKTYKSVLEGKATGNPTKSEPKMEGEPNPSLGSKEDIIEKKETKRSSTIDVSLKPKANGKEEKVIEKKKDGDQGKKENEITSTQTIDGSLKPKEDLKAEKEEVVERKEDGEIGSIGEEVRRTEKEIAATKRTEAELKIKERDEKMVEEEIQHKLKRKKVEDVNAEVPEPKRVDLGDSRAEESARDGGGTEKMIGKGLESKTGPLLIEERQKTDMDTPAVGGSEEIVKKGRVKDNEEREKYELPLVNVGVAALVIMGFGAYIFLPLLKLFY